jgi:hypothetical protein
LRAPTQLFAVLNETVKRNVIEALKSTRLIEPHENNWVLFSSMVEAALLLMGEKIDDHRLYYGLKKFETDWYVGDGTYTDGKYYHWDYYNSFVIHPMYIDILRVLSERNETYKDKLQTAIQRGTRYAAILERMIMPDGTYPVIGRSVAYRFGAFQLLAQSALQGFLPDNVTAGQVRSALTAVIKKCMESPQTFDKDGWLVAGVYGSQPEVAESYINVGSLYLCSTVFLPLGLPCSSAFWTDLPRDWTNKRIWSGESVEMDFAID